VSKKKKKGAAPASEAPHAPAETETEAAAAPEVGPTSEGAPESLPVDPEETVNLSGDPFALPGRDDLEAPTQTALSEALDKVIPGPTKKHLRGLVEALIFAADHPITPKELARTASAQTKEVKEVLEELKKDFDGRGIQLEEVAGGYTFRTNPVFAPFVRDLTGQKPVKLTRAQIETLAILAYRQPITRPEIDEIRGVDSGPVLKLLLERDLVRILGKKDEPGRPLLYGTTNDFLEFFGLKSVKDLPTLREFTELTEDSKRVVEQELGETLETVQEAALEADAAADSHTPDEVRDTVSPPEEYHPTDAPPEEGSGESDGRD
jgi:segregation and condensation protein B